MADIVALETAVTRLVGDGVSVALEGFSHLVPFAAGHEILRQRPRNLTIVRMVPDLIVDQLIGAGLVRRLTFSWGGKTYGFCCEGCIDEFKKNPEKYKNAK